MTPKDQSQFFDQSDLLRIAPPEPPEDFAAFWSDRYRQALTVHPRPSIRHTGRQIDSFELYDLTYRSTGGVEIHGWLTLPSEGAVERAIIVGHGYGGCPEPTGHVPLNDAAYIWPCLRGLGRSEIDGVPQDPNHHVLYDIDDRENYILGGCVEDLWLAVSATEKLFPATRSRIGFMGISFSGGVGVMAAAWDERIGRSHFEVPTFGHHELRMNLPSWGSARAIQDFHEQNPDVMETLAFYDAAGAARFIEVPVHIAAALHDPFVTPPGQFAIFNALTTERSLYVLEQGHSEYENADRQQKELLERLADFFSPL